MVNKALKKVEEVIRAKKGNFLKKSEPKVVGEKEEAEEAEDVDGTGRGVVMSEEDEEEEGIDVDLPGSIFFSQEWELIFLIVQAQAKTTGHDGDEEEKS